MVSESGNHLHNPLLILRLTNTLSVLNPVCAGAGPGEPAVTGVILQRKEVTLTCTGPNAAYGKGCVQSRDCNLDFARAFIITETPLSTPSA